MRRRRWGRQRWAGLPKDLRLHEARAPRPPRGVSAPGPQDRFSRSRGRVVGLASPQRASCCPDATQHRAAWRPLPPRKPAGRPSQPHFPCSRLGVWGPDPPAPVAVQEARGEARAPHHDRLPEWGWGLRAPPGVHWASPRAVRRCQQAPARPGCRRRSRSPPPRLLTGWWGRRGAAGWPGARAGRRPPGTVPSATGRPGWTGAAPAPAPGGPAGLRLPRWAPGRQPCAPRPSCGAGGQTAPAGCTVWGAGRGACSPAGARTPPAALSATPARPPRSPGTGGASPGHPSQAQARVGVASPGPDASWVPLLG